MANKQFFTITGRLPGYNELRQHWATSAKIKRNAMNIVMWEAKRAKIKPVTGTADITIKCYEPNARRDDDNVQSGADKIILDALQQLGIIQGDGRKYITRNNKTAVEVDRINPRIEIEIVEI